MTEGGLTFGRSESGFDTLSSKYYGNTTSPKAYADLHWPTGTVVSGYPNMYITEVECQLECDTMYMFTVKAKGLLTTQAVKRTISTKSQSYSTGAVNIPGTGAVAQASGIYTNLACSFHYVSLFIPILNVEPQDATLPPGASLPSPPSNPFSTTPAAPNYTATPIYNYPWGWVREGIDIDSVNGAEVYMVKEEWVYKYEFLPG